MKEESVAALLKGIDRWENLFIAEISSVRFKYCGKNGLNNLFLACLTFKARLEAQLTHVKTVYS